MGDFHKGSQPRHHSILMNHSVYVHAGTIVSTMKGCPFEDVMPHYCTTSPAEPSTECGENLSCVLGGFLLSEVLYVGL